MISEERKNVLPRILGPRGAQFSLWATRPGTTRFSMDSETHYVYVYRTYCDVLDSDGARDPSLVVLKVGKAKIPLDRLGRKLAALRKLESTAIAIPARRSDYMPATEPLSPLVRFCTHCVTVRHREGRHRICSASSWRSSSCAPLADWLDARYARRMRCACFLTF